MPRIVIVALAILVLTLPVHADSAAITITTFAGPQEVPGVSDGIGTDARFRCGSNQKGGGIVLDRRGNVYVADTFNHSIRKVAPSGAVTTFAGLFWAEGHADGPGSEARFAFPWRLAMDRDENMYVADTLNNAIRKITPDGTVSTITGPGPAGSADGPAATASFYLPSGIAVASDGTMFVTDNYNHTIRKISAAGEVTTLAGKPRTPGSVDGVGANARFYYPESVAVDQAGNVYVTELWNYAIRKITPDGTVSTFCGRMDVRGSVDGPCATATFQSLATITITELGELYVADNYQIRKIDSSGRVSTIAGSATVGDVRDGPITSARFASPRGVAIAPDGAIYVMDGKLRRISDGRVTTVAGMTTEETRVNVDGLKHAARFENPSGIAADPDGNLYVTDEYTIRMITPEGQVSTIAGRPGIIGNATGPAATATFDVARGLAFSNGSIYVADRHNNVIKKISNGTVTRFAGSTYGNRDGSGTAAQFTYPEAIAADAAGNLYVADGPNKTIRKITPSGMVSTFATGFNWPMGVAVDAAANVYVIDSEDHVVRKIDPSGHVSTLAGQRGTSGVADGAGSSARFRLLTSIAAAADGTLYIGDDSAMRRIDPAGNVTTIAGSNVSVITGQLEGWGNTDGTGEQAQLERVRGIVVMPDGNLFLTDNGAIRLGRPVIDDEATGSIVSEDPEIVQLDTSAATATSWDWRIMRRPADARATLSSTDVKAPTFRADIPGLYIIRLTASGPAGARVSYFGFLSNTTPPPKRRSVKH